MGTRLCGCLLSQPWGPELFTLNLETGAEARPGPAWWDRVVRCMGVGREVVSRAGWRGRRRGRARRRGLGQGHASALVDGRW
jgi:hypothetical protein